MWPQLCLPMIAWEQLIKDVSDPLHTTLSRKIWILVEAVGKDVGDRKSTRRRKRGERDEVEEDEEEKKKKKEFDWGKCFPGLPSLFPGHPKCPKDS